jgi:hypothetical protein
MRSHKLSLHLDVSHKGFISEQLICLGTLV